MVDRQRPELTGQISDGLLFSVVDGVCEWIIGVRVWQDAVDDHVLGGQSDGREFGVGAGDLGQSGVLGAGDEDEAGERRVSQRGDRPGVHGALFVQPGQWSQAGRVTFAVCEEVGP